MLLIIQKKIVSFLFSKNRSADCIKELFEKLKNIDVKFFCTDKHKGFLQLIPWKKHIASKKYTQSIERNNLTLRIKIARLIRKTLCFSKSQENHEFIIGSYIEKHLT